MDEPFAYTTTKSGDGLTIAVSGDIDMTNAAAFTDVLISEHAARVIVDLTGVTFMDSSGLRALVAAQLYIAHRNGELVVHGARGPVQRVIELMGLDKVLPSDDPNQN